MLAATAATAMSKTAASSASARLARAALVLICCFGTVLQGLATAVVQPGGELYGTHPRDLTAARAAASAAATTMAAAVASAAAAAAKVNAAAPSSAAGPGAQGATGRPAVAAPSAGPVVVVPPLERYVYDIALSSGYRPLYGATFASCLVGLMASGATRHAAGLHLLLSDARLLNFSLVHNLAHMGTHVRVSLYDMEGASNSMRARNTFYQLLRVPDLASGGRTATATAAPAVVKDRQEAGAVSGGGGGGSELPSVFLEDDVWLVDDFPRKMHRVASHAAQRTGGASFIIKLYLHSGKYGQPDAVRALHAETCNVTATAFPAPHAAADEIKGAVEGGPSAVLVTAFPPLPRTTTTTPGPAAAAAASDPSLEGYRAKPRMYKWGAQGLYFSDGATRRRLADCYLQYTAKSFERQRRLKDWPLKKCLLELNVSTFDSGRSLVQHIGAASSLFGDAASNSRYHRACNFPFLERLPSEDDPRDWF